MLPLTTTNFFVEPWYAFSTAVIFDCYDITQSMKQKLRAKRALGKDMEVTLEELLSASKTNVVLSNTHFDAVPRFFNEGDGR